MNDHTLTILSNITVLLTAPLLVLGCGMDGSRSSAPTGNTSQEAPRTSPNSDPDKEVESPTQSPESFQLPRLNEKLSLHLKNGRLPGGNAVQILVIEGVIEEIGEQITADVGDDTQIIDLRGSYVTAAFVDSHVHLSYLPVAQELAAKGVLGAIDLAAPIESLDSPPEMLQLLSAGPMLTSVGGYPTQSWGRNGYGRQVASPEEAAAAAEQLLDRGADLLKIPFGSEPELADEAVSAAISVAHLRGVKVAAHALSNSAAFRARRLGCDLLAHTPTESLSEATLSAWSTGAVISTLLAFGGSEEAKNNLAQLAKAGATILYGTDLGNLRTVGIATEELGALQDAGLSESEVLGAATSSPAEYWNIEVGRLEKGEPVNLLILPSDPFADWKAFQGPLSVISSHPPE